MSAWPTVQLIQIKRWTDLGERLRRFKDGRPLASYPAYRILEKITNKDYYVNMILLWRCYEFGFGSRFARDLLHRRS